MGVNGESKMKERRNNSRKACFFAEVDYAVDNRVYTDTIRNISTGGVFIETDYPFEVGTDFRMLFSDYSNINLIQVAGDVIRRSPAGVAVRFDIETNTQFKDITKYISKI